MDFYQFAKVTDTNLATEVEFLLRCKKTPKSATAATDLLYRCQHVIQVLAKQVMCWYEQVQTQPLRLCQI